MTDALNGQAADAERTTSGAQNPLIRKLSNFTKLSAEEEAALLSALDRPVDFGASEDIVNSGDATGGVKLLLTGFACRYKLLPDGRRQILDFLIPGDLCDLHVFLLDRMDHSIAALTDSRIASPANILRFTDQYPNLTRALWWTTLVNEAIAREWVVNLGQRTAHERMAHLFCELFYRMRSIDAVQGTSYPLPLTQIALADTIGLSSVHVNRTLQDLRRDGLISFRGGKLTINNLQALEKAGSFTPEYLHLRG